MRYKPIAQVGYLQYNRYHINYVKGDIEMDEQQDMETIIEEAAKKHNKPVDTMRQFVMMKTLTDNERAVYSLIVSLSRQMPVLISSKALVQKLRGDGTNISSYTVLKILKSLEYNKYIYVFDTKSQGYIYSVRPIKYVEGMAVAFYI